VVAVLWGIEPLFRLNQDAEAWLGQTQLSASLLARCVRRCPMTA
jgi:hypothetical protein